MMKGNTTFNHKNFIISFIICLIIVVSLIPLRAHAAGAIDTNADVSLKIQYTHKNKNVTGASFNLYRVADVSASGEYTLTEEFKKYPVTLEGMTAEQWSLLSDTLDGYVKRDNLTPLDQGTTDSDGVLTFPKEQASLKPGLYLVSGRRRVIGRYTYTAQTFLISLPGLENGQDEWKYHVTVSPKYDWDYDEPDGGNDDSTINRKVLKVWKDEGHENVRPTEIAVQLLRDGAVYQTVLLNAGNNWRHTWYGLDEDYDWTVVEQEPSNYTVSVAKEGITFMVTNTYTEKRPEEPENDTPGGNTPGGNSPGGGTPDDGVSLGDGFSPGGNLYLGGGIPQTGQLWWPVPVLAGAGMLLILLGLLRRRGAGYEE